MPRPLKVYQDAAGEWRWSLLAANNRITCDSGEGYSTRRKAIEGFDRVRQIVIDTLRQPVEDTIR